MTHWVFAYGSNMNLPDVRRWFLEHDREWREPERVEAAMLVQHRLAWNYYSRTRRSGAANVESVEAGESASLPGVAMVVGDAFLRGIDAKEGHPSRYRRSLRAVCIQNGATVEAWVYSVEPEFLRSSPPAPSRAYLSHMLCAARRYCFPEEYVAELEALMDEADGR